MYRVEVSIYGPVEDLCIGPGHIKHVGLNGALCDEVDAHDHVCPLTRSTWTGDALLGPCANKGTAEFLS